MWSGPSLERTPAFIALPLSAVAVVTVTALCGHGRAALALALLAIVVFLTGWAARLPVTAGITVGSWLFLIGFVVDAEGVLRFHGTADVVRLLVLAGAGLAGWLARAVAMAVVTRRRVHRNRLDIPPHTFEAYDDLGPPFHISQN
jgi:hypothetical protein